MKKLLYILIFFSIRTQAQIILFTARLPWITAATIKDDGYYNGFPMVSHADDINVWGVYKKSQSHSGNGPLMLVKSTDGGFTWTEDSVRVAGKAINISNHSFKRLPFGRIVVAYKDTAAIKIAYSDNNGSSFIQTTRIDTTAGYAICPSPIKMMQTSYGALLFAYYKVGSGTNPSSAILMQSLDSGKTWAQKAVIYSHDSTQAQGSSTVNWKGNEVAIVETHPTGVETTSKMMAFVRVDVPNDGGTYPMVFKSIDGGNTWYADGTTDSGSFVDDNGATVSSSSFSRKLLYSFLSSNSPLDAIVHKGLVYVVYGERNLTYGYALKYITASPDSAFSNRFSAWTRPTLVKKYNANTAGSTYDCGYPILFEANWHLYVSEYDVSTQPLDAAKSNRRVLSEIIKIAD